MKKATGPICIAIARGQIVARGRLASSVRKSLELLGIAELFGVPTSRLEQPAQSLQDRRIIVEEADNIGVRIGQS